MAMDWGSVSGQELLVALREVRGVLSLNSAATSWPAH